MDNGYYPKYGTSKMVTSRYPLNIHDKNVELDQFVQIMGALDKPLVLFTAPFCDNTENVNEFISKLNQKVNGLKDYSRLFKDRDDYFYNCSHLNHKGAQEFSKVTALELNKAANTLPH